MAYVYFEMSVLSVLSVLYFDCQSKQRISHNNSGIFLKHAKETLMKNYLVTTYFQERTFAKYFTLYILFYIVPFYRLMWYPEENHALSGVVAEADVFMNYAQWITHHLSRKVD